MSHYGPSSGQPPPMRNNRGMRPPPPPPPRRGPGFPGPMMQRHPGGPPPPRQGNGFLPPPPPPPPPPPRGRGFVSNQPPPMAYRQQQQRPMQPLVGAPPQGPLHVAPPVMPPHPQQHQQLMPPPMAQQFVMQRVNMPQSMPMAPQAVIAQVPIQRVVQPAPVATAAAPPSQQGWTQHAHEGRIFYYNSITKQSTYDRPACLSAPAAASVNMNAAGLSLSVINGTANADATKLIGSGNINNNNNAPTKWKEYTDPTSNKKYYSDGVTTTWTRPAELGPEKSNEPSATAAAATGTAANNPTTKKDKRKRDPQCTSSSTITSTPYSSKSEATAAFKGLLLAKAITPHQKYQEVSKLCSDDSRWDALQTIGERKQALAEYQTKRNNELKEMKRVEVQRGKEAFHRLLSDIVLGNNTTDDSTSTVFDNPRYEQYRDQLSLDDRFHAIEHEEMRRQIFYEYMEESQKRIMHNKRLKARQIKESFVDFLRSCEEKGKISRSSTYTSFIHDLSSEEKESNGVFGSVKEADRQIYFADYVLRLQESHDEKQRRILEAGYRAEKAQRQDYRCVLLDIARRGTRDNNINNDTQKALLRPYTHWKEIQPILCKTSAYEAVYAQDVELPRELYVEFVNSWRDVYSRDKKVLHRALGLLLKKKKKSNNNKSEKKKSYEEFESNLLEVAVEIPDLYTELRRIASSSSSNSNGREVAVSSFRVFYEEYYWKEDGVNGGEEEESSEDEGEIIED